MRREHGRPEAGPDPVETAAVHVVLDPAPHQPQNLAVLGRHGKVGRLEHEQLGHLARHNKHTCKRSSRPQDTIQYSQYNSGGGGGDTKGA